MASLGATDVHSLAATHALIGSLMAAPTHLYGVALVEGRSPNLVVHTLARHVASGEQHAVLAISALQLLAISAEACKSMLQAGLVPLLINMLLGGGKSFEPLTRIQALKLLTCLVSHSTALCHMSASMDPIVVHASRLPSAAAVRVVVKCLAAEDPGCVHLALQLLEEVIVTQKGLCAAMAALDLPGALQAAAAAAEPRLSRKVAQVERLLTILPSVMSKAPLQTPGS